MSRAAGVGAPPRLVWDDDDAPASAAGAGAESKQVGGSSNDDDGFRQLLQQQRRSRSSRQSGLAQGSFVSATQFSKIDARLQRKIGQHSRDCVDTKTINSFKTGTHAAFDFCLFWF
jgi:hypothetical protein